MGALCAGYAFYWQHAAGLLQDGIAAWSESERAAGGDVSFSTGEITGFPFAFRRDFQDVILVRPAADGVLMLKAGRVTATMRPWNLQMIAFDATAPIEISLSPPLQDAVTIGASALIGDIRLMADGRLEQIALKARDVTATDNDQAYAAATVDLTLDLPPLTPRDHREKLLGFDLALGDLQIPGGQRAVTAEPVAKVALVGTIMGPMAMDAPPRAALARWALDGGTVELSHFAFAQTPLDVEGDGTLALDRNQQLLGALTIRAQGLTETIDLLAADGMLEPGAAKTGRMMAEGMAKLDDKGRKVVNVALSLQQGFIWLGPIKLAPLPVLTW